MNKGSVWRLGRRGIKALAVATALIAGSIQVGPALAVPLQPKLTITLHPVEGEPVVIGTLHVTAGDGGYRFRVEIDDRKFEDQFLSMRPFKCLPHPRQVVCRLPYPYENKRFVTATDLTDLEYDLLFLHKTPEEYGINAWNGLYFELSMTEKGFVGELRETDLNVLAAPPETGDLRPIGKADLYEASDKHWLRRITIE